MKTADFTGTETRVVFDIETIPAQKPEIREAVLSTLKPPGNIKKAESIEKWLSDPDNQANALKKTSLDPAFGEVCSIGFKIGDSRADCIQRISGDASAEKSVLGAFMELVSDLPHPVLIGHNIRGFDIPYLWKRCMVNSVAPKTKFIKLVNQAPNHPQVRDTMLLWAGGYANASNYISMDKLATCLGLPGKGDVDGSMVADLWDLSDFKTIKQYCISDVETTASIYSRMEAWL